MKILSSRIFWGIVLIIGGVLFLLQNQGIFQGSDLFWGATLVIAGLLFIGVYLGERKQWWALIPGIVLLALGSLILLSGFAPGFNNNLGGFILLGGIGLSFILVYFAERTNWWAIIPGGVLITIGVISALDGIVTGGLSGGLFFIGLGVTFAMVGLIPTATGKMRWAWIPAIILVLFGLMLFFTEEKMLDYFLPAVIILVGSFLIWRALRYR